MLFTKDQTRTLENLHSNLARSMAEFYSKTVESVVDADIAYVDQTTYAEFIMSLDNPSCSYTFTIEPFSGPAILNFSMDILNAFMSYTSSDTASYAPGAGRDRPINDEERARMTRIVSQTLVDLEHAWKSLEKIQVSDGELDTNPEAMQIVEPSHTVLLVAFELNFQHYSGLISLCYPFSTLDSVRPKLDKQEPK